MVNFRDKFIQDFGTTKRVKKLTKEFKRVKPKEFEKIEKTMRRFK